MSIRTKPLHPVFVVEVVGVDLALPMSREMFGEIEAVFNRHAVLVFPGQRLTDEQQMAFSRLFGPLETAPNYAGKKLRVREEITDISNLDHQGRILDPEDRLNLYNLGNQLWHTDSSFKHVPAKCSLLYAREIPTSGGETEFADMRAAFDALPDERKHQLKGLVAEHSIHTSRRRTGFVEFNEDVSQRLPPVQQLLVRRHPGSGRTTLYLASHASHVVGWPVAKGAALLDDLIAFATQPRFVYTHRWRVGDLVIWDDRCTMHRGRPYDPASRRVLHRTTVADVANSLEQERDTVLPTTQASEKDLASL